MSEINLVEWVTEELTKLGHPTPNSWEASLNVVPETNPGVALPVDQQQFKINRVFQYLLGNLPMNTMDVRMFLVQMDDSEAWRRTYTSLVLPFWVNVAKSKE